MYAFFLFLMTPMLINYDWGFSENGLPNKWQFVVEQFDPSIATYYFSTKIVEITIMMLQPVYGIYGVLTSILGDDHQA